MTRVRDSLATRWDAVTLSAAAFVVLVAGAAVAAPLLAPDAPNAVDYHATFQGPSGHHLLGTDELGRDLLSRVMYGGRVSLVGVLEALLVYLALGIPTGLVAGYVGRWLGAGVVWLAEVSFSLPQIVIVLAVLAVFSSGTHAAMIVLGLLGAPGLAVMVHGATQTVIREQYIAAARVSGLRAWQILLRHVLPRIAGTIIVQASLFAGIALIFQTGLEFLGLGAHPPTASWGAMVAEGSRYLARDAWMIVPSGVVITLTVLALSLLGDAIRDVRAGVRSAVTPLALSGEARVASDDSRSFERAAAPTSLAVGSFEGGVRHIERQGDGSPPTHLGAAVSRRSPSKHALLSVDGLSVTTAAGAVALVDDVSLDLEAGAALGIVGESGCGKTLTTLAITGLLPPSLKVTSGRWFFDGRALHDLSERQLSAVRGAEISTISQEPVATLDPSFTVGAQVAEVVRRHRRTTRKHARAEALRLLEQVRLPEADLTARKYPHELSGGMAQRVAIAAALAGGPRLLIADEPTTALDPTVQADILDLLRLLQRQTGLAIILVSHDWGVIADLCDSAAVMYAGQVVEIAAVAEIFDSPRHPYTRALIESNPHYAAEPRTELPMIPGTVVAPGQWPTGCHFAARCRFREEDCTARPIDEQPASEGHWTRCIHHHRLDDLVALEEGTLHG